MKERIREMQAERDESATQVSNIHDLKYAVHTLEHDLLHERTKIKALSEELDRPLNVHRWRMLESSDPQRFEMIKKIQGLQKRIIQKTEEVVEKDLLIQEKEKLYVELKNILGRQPGPRVAEQLAVYQSNLKQKMQQMKAMSSELDMYKQQVTQFRHPRSARSRPKWKGQARLAEALVKAGDPAETQVLSRQRRHARRGRWATTRADLGTQGTRACSRAGRTRALLPRPLIYRYTSAHTEGRCTVRLPVRACGAFSTREEEPTPRWLHVPLFTNSQCRTVANR